MKFKVGNKVKFVKKLENHSDKVRLGGIYKIKYVNSFTSYMPYRVENGEWFGEKELELANYTYEDLKKSPIGTRVIFQNGSVLIKTRKDRFENYIDHTYIEYLKNLEDNSHGKIIKIEEPEYKTVYEYKPEILDEVEKRYLRGVIRPFRDKVTYIEKANVYDCSFIRIATNEEDIVLPHFKADAMYKGMKTNKAYTLEELGL